MTCKAPHDLALSYLSHLIFLSLALALLVHTVPQLLPKCPKTTASCFHNDLLKCYNFRKIFPDNPSPAPATAIPLFCLIFLVAIFTT